VAQLAEKGIAGSYLGIAPDAPGALEDHLARGFEHDALLVTGGVSAGEYDLVAETLERLGARLLFHGVSMRPGKPILAASRGRCTVVALPGNPVSAFTGFAVFVAPALRKMSGHPCPDGKPIAVRLAEPLRRKPGRTTYALAHVEVVDGAWVARPARSAGSGDVLSLVRANAFLVVPGDPHAVEAGTLVDAILWDS
jgi:molybdopterin molybdotransferase